MSRWSKGITLQVRNNGFHIITLCIDLNSMEQNANYPNATLAVVPSRMHLNVLQMECKLPMVAFEELISVGKNACMQMHEILKDNIQTHTWKRLAARDTL